MANILVIGFGNPLRSDDSFGLQAVEQLKQDVRVKEVEFVECQQLTPELAEKVAKSDLVLFVDADTDGVAGSIHCRQIVPKKQDAAMAHHLDPCALLGISEKLYRKVPEAMLVTVTGECFGYGKQLTFEVQKALPGVVQHMKEMIEEKVAPRQTVHA